MSDAGRGAGARMVGRRGGILIRLLAAACCAILATMPTARGEETYAVFDSLYLQRDNVAAGRPLVLESLGGAPAINTADLQFAVQPGMRLFYGHVGDGGPGWEVGYLGVWGMFADASATNAAGTLQAPDPLGTQVGVLNGADLARATYRSSLNSAEFNLFSRWCDGGYDRRAGEPWRRCGNYDGGSLDWLAGFRWAGLDESAALAFSPSGNPGAGIYAVNATTNLFAAQVGGRGRMSWDRWAIEGWAKVALAGSAMRQSQAPIENSIILFQERPGVSSSEGGVGLIGDINVTAVYRLTETWGLRVGYNMIWLSGVTLAPNQFDFGAPPAGGTNLNGGSSVFLSGANLGLEARW